MACKNPKAPILTQPRRAYTEWPSAVLNICGRAVSGFCAPGAPLCLGTCRALIGV